MYKVKWFKQDNWVMNFLKPEKEPKIKWYPCMVLSEEFNDPRHKLGSMVFISLYENDSPIPVYAHAIYDKIEGN
jgi:hypothetical protein